MMTRACLQLPACVPVQAHRHGAMRFANRNTTSSPVARMGDDGSGNDARPPSGRVSQLRERWERWSIDRSAPVVSVPKRLSGYPGPVYTQPGVFVEADELPKVPRPRPSSVTRRRRSSSGSGRSAGQARRRTPKSVNRVSSGPREQRRDSESGCVRGDGRQEAGSGAEPRGAGEVATAVAASTLPVLTSVASGISSGIATPVGGTRPCSDDSSRKLRRARGVAPRDHGAERGRRPSVPPRPPQGYEVSSWRHRALRNRRASDAAALGGPDVMRPVTPHDDTVLEPEPSLGAELHVLAEGTSDGTLTATTTTDTSRDSTWSRSRPSSEEVFLEA